MLHDVPKPTVGRQVEGGVASFVLHVHVHPTDDSQQKVWMTIVTVVLEYSQGVDTEAIFI